MSSAKVYTSKRHRIERPGSLAATRKKRKTKRGSNALKVLQHAQRGNRDRLRKLRSISMPPRRLSVDPESIQVPGFQELEFANFFDPQIFPLDYPEEDRAPSPALHDRPPSPALHDRSPSPAPSSDMDQDLPSGDRSSPVPQRRNKHGKRITGGPCGSALRKYWQMQSKKTDLGAESHLPGWMIRPNLVRKQLVAPAYGNLRARISHDALPMIDYLARSSEEHLIEKAKCVMKLRNRRARRVGVNDIIKANQMWSSGRSGQEPPARCL